MALLLVDRRVQQCQHIADISPTLTCEFQMDKETCQHSLITVSALHSVDTHPSPQTRIIGDIIVHVCSASSNGTPVSRAPRQRGHHLTLHVRFTLICGTCRLEYPGPRSDLPTRELLEIASTAKRGVAWEGRNRKESSSFEATDRGSST